MQDKSWYVFISQTGSEVKSISELCCVKPKMIISNNLGKISKDVLSWIQKEKITLYSLPSKPLISDYRNIKIPKDSLITLHGYLRILPKEFCLEYENIYNGHPALILETKYPELKGKDPQERTWNEKEKYPTVGTVIHKVIPELDAGEIILYNEANNISETKVQHYHLLKNLSLKLWIDFFENLEQS
jgi:folate-dependent phosphoribosylglycinamide formyltransferase PurN